MSSKPTHATLQQALDERDAEIAALRAQLAAATSALPGTAGNTPAWLEQMQDLFAGVVLTNAQGYITWANAGFLDLCKCSLSELIRQPLITLPAESAVQESIAAGLGRQEPFQFEMRSKAALPNDWLQVKVQPLRNSAWEVEAFVGVAEDISQRKSSQLASSRNEVLLRDLAENVPCVLYRWRKLADGTLQSVYCSPKLTEIFGLEVAEAHTFSDYIHPDDQAAWQESVATSIANSGTWHFEGRLVVPGQPMRWWRGHSVLSYYDTQGTVFTGILEDITAVRQAEEAARRDSLRSILTPVGLGIGNWEFNYRTRCTVVSEECKTVAGYPGPVSPDECVPLMSHVHPADRAAVHQQWQAYHRGETEVFNAEHRLRCFDGSYKWVLTRGLTTQHDDQGKPLIFTGILSDISVRRKGEDDLAATALRLSVTIKSLQRGVLLVNENHKVVLTNASFCKLFNLGASPEQLEGTDYALIEAKVQRALAGPVDLATIVARQQSVRHDLIPLRDGHMVECDFVPIHDGDASLGYIWKFEDITERRNTEMSLRRREEKYRTIIDNMHLGLVEVDLEQRVLYANPNYCRLIGYTIDELLGTPIPPLLLPQGSPPYYEQLLRQRAQGISSTYELPIVTKTGQTKWLFTGAAPLYDEDRRVAGTIGISLDITHQKQLEQSLREAKEQAEDSTKAKELFLANMSHEIRTPMNAILGMSQLLAKTPLAARQSNYLHAITTSAQNLLVIINDILDLSKLDAGKMTIEQVGFNVARLCAQVEKTLLYKAEEKGLQLLLKVSPLIPDVVLGDPYRINQILLNLAGNAIKFTAKGQVVIECDVAGYRNGKVLVSFAVADTGIGIDAAYLRHIFQEFSQEDTSITRKFGGTGLGLSICRSLARLMGSEIYIESEKNQGTTIHFTLALPMGTVQDLPQRSWAAGTSTKELRGKSVLLVEDNAYNRLLAKTFLDNAHLLVTEAENGQMAIACVQQQRFDLILMDVQMPVMDGFEATQYLRKQLGLKTPIIALTASAVNGEKEKCLAAGMNDYLTKPFYEDELLHLVHDWVLGPIENMPAVSTELAVTEPTALYTLDILIDTARGDQKFVLTMLHTFIEGTRNALRDLNRALEVGSLPALRATAHKLRPSLVHLQVQPVVAIMATLENWTGTFCYDDLQPLVETADRLLHQVIVEMTAELEVRRAELAG